MQTVMLNTIPRLLLGYDTLPFFRFSISASGLVPPPETVKLEKFS